MAGKHRFRSARSTEPESEPRRELTIEEVIHRYRGEWVVMHISEDDEDFWPAKGFVLTHASRQPDALAALDDLPSGWREVDLPLCSFQAQPDLGPGPEYESFLAELRARITPPN